MMRRGAAATLAMQKKEREKEHSQRQEQQEQEQQEPEPRRPVELADPTRAIDLGSLRWTGLDVSSAVSTHTHSSTHTSPKSARARWAQTTLIS